MENFFLLMKENQDILNLIYLIVIILLVLLNIILIFKFNKLQKTYDFFVKGRENINIDEFLKNIVEEVRQNSNSIQEINDVLKREKEAVDLQLQNICQNIEQKHEQISIALQDNVNTINSDINDKNTALNDKIDKINVELLQNLDNTKSDLLADYNKKIDLLNNQCNMEFEAIREKMKSCIQNVELKRYDAFENITGEQSFSACLLDDNNNGIVISSLYGREDNRSYGKKIINGKPIIKLSAEEEEIINKIIK